MWVQTQGEERAIETKTHQLDSRVYEYALLGDHGPVLVFLCGFRMNLRTWDKVIPHLREEGRVFAYNRLGVGASSRAQDDQTASTVVAQLRELLNALELPPPYILVAHSVGGIFCHYYARNFPEELAAVVFVEAAHPEEAAAQNAFKPPLLLHALNEGLKSVQRLFDPYCFSEAESMGESLREISSSASFPSVPVSIVSGTSKMPFVPTESFELHLAYQAKLQDVSPQSRVYAAMKSGHFPQITEPDLVVTAIRETVASTR